MYSMCRSHIWPLYNQRREVRNSFFVTSIFTHRSDHQTLNDIPKILGDFTEYIQIDIGYKVGGHNEIPPIVIPLSKFKSITIQFKSKSIEITGYGDSVKTSKQPNYVQKPSAIVISPPSREIYSAM